MKNTKPSLYNRCKKIFSINLELKLLLAFVLAASIPIHVLYNVSSHLVLSKIADIQVDRIAITYQNVVRELDNEKSTLYSDDIDYGHWSEMYNAVMDKKLGWFEGAFSTLLSPHKGVNIISVMDIDGNAVYEKGTNQDFAAECGRLLRIVENGDEFVTLKVLNNKLYMLSFARITYEENTDECGGYLVLGKELNKGALDKFPKTYGFYYDLVYNGISARGDTHVTAADQKRDSKEKYFKLYNRLGEVAAFIYIRDESSFVDNILSSIKKSLTAAVIVTYLIAILLAAFFRDTIMKPVKALRKKVREMRNSCYLDSGGRSNEIKLLTEEFEAMSAEIKSHSQEMEAKNKELEYLVYNDDITGAYNKRYFVKNLPEELQIAERQNGVLSLIFMVIDHFRYYEGLVSREQKNDTLTRLYQLIVTELLSDSKVCFDGVDSFKIIMPGVDYKEALQYADNISKKIALSHFDGMEGLPEGCIDISCGMASYPKDATEYNKLIIAVEDRLERIKYHNQGKIGYFYSLFSDFKTDIDENKKALIYMSKAFLSVIDAMDQYTYTHTEGVVKYSIILADQMRLSSNQRDNIRLGALLHDVGKLELGRDILNKKEKLTDEEMSFIRQHPIYGVKMLQHLEYFKEIEDMVKYHHERYDGRGYPYGLKGEEIPLAARIIAVADSFDAMTTKRVYRTNHKSFEEAAIELKKCAGTQFDPIVVNAFLEYVQNNGYNFLLVE